MIKALVIDSARKQRHENNIRCKHERSPSPHQAQSNVSIAYRLQHNPIQVSVHGYLALKRRRLSVACAKVQVLAIDSYHPSWREEKTQELHVSLCLSLFFRRSWRLQVLFCAIICPKHTNMDDEAPYSKGMACRDMPFEWNNDTFRKSWPFQA